MARTAQGAQLTIAHRQRQLALRAAALSDMLAIWRAVDPTNLRATIGPFAAATAVLARARFQESAALAAAYYTRYREAEGARGVATIVPPDPPARVEAASLLRGAALSGILNGRRRGFSVEAAAQNGYVKASGSLSNIVLGAARQTVTEAAGTDPRSTGKWRRVAGGSACEFCSMLEGRGAVFSATTSDFQAHDHCACTAEPEFT